MRIRMLIAGIAMLLALVAPRGTIHANVFIVNSTADSGDGICNAAECTLREAIVAANANPPGPHLIVFAIPGAGPHTIVLLAPLPSILVPVVIAGYTQGSATVDAADDAIPNSNSLTQGSNAVLKIELDGSNAGAGISGLIIS